MELCENIEQGVVAARRDAEDLGVSTETLLVSTLLGFTEALKVVGIDEGIRLVVALLAAELGRAIARKVDEVEDEEFIDVFLVAEDEEGLFSD